jgi:hypothetical protein
MITELEYLALKGSRFTKSIFEREIMYILVALSLVRYL